MAVKNFIFKGNSVGSKVAGMKTTFFVIFDSTWNYILAPKGPNKEFPIQHFSFQLIRKTELTLLILRL